MEAKEISSKEYEIPSIFIDADYIPAELLVRGRDFQRFLKIDGKIWVANVRDGYQFYERYKRERKHK